MRALEGIKVVELGTHVAIPKVARVMADWERRNLRYTVCHLHISSHWDWPRSYIPCLRTLFWLNERFPYLLLSYFGFYFLCCWRMR